MVAVAPGNLENAEVGAEISEILSSGFDTCLVFLPKEYTISGLIGQKSHRKFEWQRSDDCGLSVDWNLRHHSEQHQMKITILTSEVTKTKMHFIRCLYSFVKIVT